MEEKNEKMSYEQLKQTADQLYADYQKLMREYQGAVRALNNFDATGFFLQWATKVVDHAEMYSGEFVTMCTNKIEYILTQFSKNLVEPEQEQKGEAE